MDQLKLHTFPLIAHKNWCLSCASRLHLAALTCQQWGITLAENKWCRSLLVQVISLHEACYHNIHSQIPCYACGWCQYNFLPVGLSMGLFLRLGMPSTSISDTGLHLAYKLSASHLYFLLRLVLDHVISFSRCYVISELFRVVNVYALISLNMFIQGCLCRSV